MIRLRALLLINRKSRQGEANAQTAVEQLRDRGVDVLEGRFDAPEDVPAEIRRHADAVDVIVLGGGDGTLNLASKAMMACGKPMAVLPLGTANDFARTLLIPTDLAAACDNVVDGIDHGIDLGLCNDVHFLNVASIGLAVRASEYRSDAAKKWFGSLGYAANVFSAVRDTRAFDAEISFDGHTERLHSIQVAVGNGRYFGGGLAVSSDAALDDGQLDLYSLKPQPLSSLIAMLPGLVRGPHKAMQGLQLFEGTAFHIRTEEPMDINTDGEILTATPATFRVLPQALTVKVPQRYIDRYGSGKSSSAA
ncbi:lipid kinase [Salinisphaera sp.]|uniref:lipid kinase n=1 Tax=Salinisphaera sp. TaxID=1914330 RepID=UPI002D772AB6|nr:lipid kinase [Salinisphaera sp.]HET7313347.1 lipid kinase [Salinisphaera sp.]